MVKIVKRYRKRNDSGGYDFSEKEMTDVITPKVFDEMFKLNQLYKFLGEIVSRPNGRYMIKKQSLKYAGMSFNQMTFRKTYFLYTDGISFSVNNKKHKDVFYTNNKRIAVRLAKLLVGSYNELISIVDRENSGNETYVLSRQQQLGSNKIIVK